MKEQAKELFEHLTGIARPAPDDIEIHRCPPVAFDFEDDGETPNNPHLPLIVYGSQVVLDARFDPAAIFEVLFDSNGWTDSWRYTMYDFNHFHTTTHECLGITRGTLTALFGGEQGQNIDLKPGDVVIIPAGVGHRRVRQSDDLLIVGAYPRNGGEYDEPKPGEIAHATAVARIRSVALPLTDPVYGEGGPLFSHWRGH